MKVCLDLHDFGVVYNRLDLLFKLKEKFPNFKVSLFTVPIEEKKDWGPSLVKDDFLKIIRANLDWMQLCVHGLNHSGSEVKRWDYEFMESLAIPLIEKTFNEYKLPITKGFCAPHWRWNEDVVRYLNEHGWWGAVDPRQPNMATPKKFYRYSYPIDNFPLDKDVLKLHGHVYGTGNDLGRCILNLFKLPTDAQWHFVDDFLEEK